MTATLDISAGEAAAARIRELVDEHTDNGPYTPRTVATEVAARLRRDEPETLNAWLDTQAENFLWQLVNHRDRSRRGRLMHDARSTTFREAATAVTETGDAAPLRRFLDTPWPVEDGTRRRLADLRKTDLEYVAGNYEQRARENSMRAAFFTALAKKVGDQTVAEVYTEDQVTQMWSSITGDR